MRGFGAIRSGLDTLVKELMITPPEAIQDRSVR
jgi:hypothetical protein